jgi:TRAP-type C4-dicarboxylate transport system permease small subunit
LDSKNSRVVEIVGYISQGLLALSGVMILSMAFTATYGVTRRYFMHNPEPYSYEISMMLLLWCFVLSVAALQKQERHLRGDFILNRLPPRFQFFINRILSPSLAVLCSVVLAWKGWEAAMFSLKIGERSTSSWAEPLFPVKVMIPIGYGFLFIVSVIQLCQGIFSSVHKYPRPGERKDYTAGRPGTKNPS